MQLFKSVSRQLTLGAVALLVVQGCTNGSAKPNFVYKTAPSENVVAKIAGEDVTLDQLIGDAKLQYLELQKRVHEFKMEQLRKLMEEKLIGSEAKKANMTLADYLDKKVVKGKNAPSDKEVEKFIDEKKIPKSQVNPQLKDKIKEYLGAQKREKAIEEHLASLTKGKPVEVYFTKPKLDIKVDVGDAPSVGNKDAKVTMVVFSDFQCPFCSRGAEAVDQIKKKYGKKLRIAFKHFPLSFHQQARPAAEASMCVNEQSTDKFWKFHDITFKNQSALDDASLEKYAKEAGANIDKYKECLGSKKYAKNIQDDMDYGEKLGVRSTPTFFINGELISGAVPVEEFSAVIDEAFGN